MKHWKDDVENSLDEKEINHTSIRSFMVQKLDFRITNCKDVYSVAKKIELIMDDLNFEYKTIEPRTAVMPIIKPWDLLNNLSINPLNGIKKLFESKKPYYTIALYSGFSRVACYYHSE